VEGNIISYEQVLREFIKVNLRILLEDPFPNNLYEAKRREFFGKKYNNKYKRPRKNTVARNLMNYLINSIQNLGELNNFFNKPFIQDNLSEKDKNTFIEIVKIKEKDEIDIDFKKIKDSTYKTKVKEKLIDEIIEESSSEINQAILEKEKEYYSIPSILDSIDIKEPDIVKKIDDDKIEFEEDLLPWWRKLDLISNPFPGNSLDKIDKNIWDEIVYKTSIFKKYQRYIDKDVDELFKNIIFYGEYGSGKSTFFEYIQPSFIKNRIIPLYILLYGENDSKSLQIKYEKKLIKELINACNKLNIHGHLRLPDSIDETIDFLFDLIIKDGQRGIIIIIDELHKNPNLDPAMDFLNNLQSYTSEQRKRKPHLDMGVFLSGSYEWKDHIEKTPIYSGSFLEYENMPNITPEIACKTINMRLKAFSRNPDNPKQIQLDAVKRAFDNLISSYIPITFRYVIKYIIDEFKKNNFDILTFDSLPSEKRKLIKNKFDQNHVIKTRFDILIYGSQNIEKIKSKENLKITLDQLVLLYLKNYVRESDTKFKEFQFNYKKLSEVGLITKSLDNIGLKWTICKELNDLNDEVIKEYGISLENYLIDIYYYDELDEVKDTLIYEDKYMNVINEVPTNTSKNIINSLMSSINKKKEIDLIFNDIDKMSYLQDINKRKEIRKDIVDSINSLTRALCLFEHISTKKIGEFWSEYWFLTDNIVRYDRHIKNKDYYQDSVSSHVNITYIKFL